VAAVPAARRPGCCRLLLRGWHHACCPAVHAAPQPPRCAHAPAPAPAPPARQAPDRRWADCGSRPSVSDDEGVAAAAREIRTADQHVPTEAADLTGDRVETGIPDLVEDLHPALALVAQLGLDRGVIGADRTVADALGRAAAQAFDPLLVP